MQYVFGSQGNLKNFNMNKEARFYIRQMVGLAAVFVESKFWFWLLVSFYLYEAIVYNIIDGFKSVTIKSSINNKKMYQYISLAQITHGIIIIALVVVLYFLKF